MRSRLPLLLCAGVLGALAAPSAAQAIDFCVPAASACPGGLGTAQATLEAALDLADNTNALDRVYLGSGTFTAPTTAGFSYNANAAPLQIFGKASSGAQKTVITTTAGATQLLFLHGGPASSLSGVELAIADNAVLNSFQMRLRNVAVSDVAVTNSATQPNAYIAVDLEDGSSFVDGSVVVSPTKGRGLLLDGAGISVARSSLSAYLGITAGSTATDATIDRVGILAGDGGAVQATGATLSLRNSLVIQGGSGNACALYALDQPFTDGVVNADGVTVVTSNASAKAACSSSIFSAPRGSAINLTNSIVRGFGHDRQTGSTDTGSTAVNVAYSDFDPSTDIAIGAGPSSFSPAFGTLGATNVNVDPLFVGGGDYALGAASPVRDIGDPAAAGGLDLIGAPRLCGQRDLGAYEFAGGATCAAVVVPLAGAGGAGAAGGTPPGAPADPNAPQAPAPAPPVPGPRADTTAPVLSALGFSHRAFRIVRGTRVRFSVSEAAAVTVLLQQRTRHGKRVAYRTWARLRRDAHAGANAVTVRGLIGQVLLKPGHYRARFSATDAAGNTARPRTIAFTVLAP